MRIFRQPEEIRSRIFRSSHTGRHILRVRFDGSSLRNLAGSSLFREMRKVKWPIDRLEQRWPIKVGVMLSLPKKRSFHERTFTENVSSRGLRAITKRLWQPGAELLVTFAGEGIQRQASVAYCQRLKRKRFAVGLKLLMRVWEAQV